MADRSVDVAIIGAGTAGLAAYRRAVEETDDVLLIEGGPYGTTCARVGCMPSKLLIAAAEVAHIGRTAAPFGVRCGSVEVDGKAVMARVRDERDRFVSFVTETIESWPASHKTKAEARFRSDDTLELSDGTTVRAGAIVIATGSRPNVPEMFADLGDRRITSDDVFFWDDLPDSVAVFGAGVIGLELGQALHRLGVRTTIFGKGDEIAQLSDPHVVDAARGILCDELRFFPDHEPLRLAAADASFEIEHKIGGRAEVERFDYALVCIGRRPNVDHLGLETTSLERDEHGIPLFDPETRRCGETGIFIAGDAAGLPILHLAAHTGKAAGTNAANLPQLVPDPFPAKLSVTFTDPQIATVGEEYASLTQRGAAFEIGEVDWSDQGRARVMGANRGLLRVYGEQASARFLGAEMIGPDAEHLAHLLSWSLQSSLSIPQMLDRPFYHPCIEEGVRTALRDLAHRLRLGPPPVPRRLDCGPGG